MGTFKTGKDVFIFITTENDSATGSIAISGGTATVCTASAANEFILPLGTAVPTTSAQINDVIGMEPNYEKEDEKVQFLGRITDDNIFLRQNSSVTITKKKTDNKWFTLFADADYGLTGSPGVINDSRGTMRTDCGYRIYIAENGTTSGGVNDDWKTLCNCKLKYKETVGPNRTQEEQLMLMGYIFKSGNTPYTSSTAQTDL